jgi:hypothetical protein
MEIKTKVNIDFKKALQKSKKHQLKKRILKQLMIPIIKDSKDFINRGLVTPELAPSTIKQREKMGITHKKPLLRTGKLMNKLTVNMNGIKSTNYAKYHFEGSYNDDRPPRRKFIVSKSETSASGYNDLGLQGTVSIESLVKFRNDFIKTLNKSIRKK